jgi:PAS domain S-box-containing protein
VRQPTTGRHDGATASSRPKRSPGAVRSPLARFPGLILEGLPIAVAVFDEAGLLVFANKAARRLGRAMPDPTRAVTEQIGKYALRDATTGKPPPIGRGPFASALRGQASAPAEYLLRAPGARKDTRIRMTATPILNADHSIAGVTVTALDVTRQRHEETELRAAETLMREVFATLACGVVVRDAKGRLSYANAAAELILGEKLRRGSGWPEHLEVFAQDGSRLGPEEMPSARARINGTSSRGETVGVDLRSGQRRWVQVDAAPIFGAARQLTNTVATFVDITAQREAEAELARLGPKWDALAAITARLGSTHRSASAIATVMAAAADGLAADHAYLVESDAAGALVLRAASSTAGSPAETQAIGVHDAGLLFAPTSAIATCLEVEERPYLLRDSTVRSAISAPITVDGRHVASVSFYSRRPSAFGPSDLRFAEVVAGLLAIALRKDSVAGITSDRAMLLGHLTPREREVLVLMARGLANRDIARKLRVTYTTERGYVRGVIEKLGARSRLEAVAHALEAGLLADA